jgi:hypothetical protein
MYTAAYGIGPRSNPGPDFFEDQMKIASVVARAAEIESKEQGLGSVGARQQIADGHAGTIGALD